VFVRAVVDSARVAIRFQQAVVSSDFIAYTFLGLFLDIMSMFISYSILEFVIGRSLQHKSSLK
jgi:hypothetical protein